MLPSSAVSQEKGVQFIQLELSKDVGRSSGGKEGETLNIDEWESGAVTIDGDGFTNIRARVTVLFPTPILCLNSVHGVGFHALPVFGSN